MKVLSLIFLLLSVGTCFADTPIWDIKNNTQPISKLPSDDTPVGLLIVGVPILVLGFTENPKNTPTGAFFFFGGTSAALGLVLVKW